MEKYYFVVPANDAEAVAIGNMLKKNGIEHATTSQTWGASWTGLEPDIKAQISCKVEEGYSVYGVELQGKAPVGGFNVDHHYYEGDNRSNPLSSIEQVSQLLGVELSPLEMAIALNDKGYIPAMREAGVSEEMISEVRQLDRAAQGITPEQEVAAEEAISNKEVCGNLTIVRMSHSKCATVTDRLFGQYTNLLIISNGEVNFYGAGNIVENLQNRFGGWSGGNLPENGFWGSGDAPAYEVEEFVRTF